LKFGSFNFPTARRVKHCALYVGFGSEVPP
jgi:hypothetical protein